MLGLNKDMLKEEEALARNLRAKKTPHALISIYFETETLAWLRDTAGPQGISALVRAAVADYRARHGDGEREAA